MNLSAGVDVTDLAGDRAVLSLRPSLDAAIAASNAMDRSDDWDEDGLTHTWTELKRVCQAIVDTPAATSPDGLALKAAAVMHQLRFSYSDGWPSAGEAMAWQFLTGLAGSAYAPPALPDYMRAACS